MRTLNYLYIAFALSFIISFVTPAQEDEEPVNYYQMEPLDDSLFIQIQEALFIDPPDPKQK